MKATPLQYSIPPSEKNMDRQTLNSKTIRRLQKRSRGICEVCRVNVAKEIHHIVSICEGGKNTISNLSYLCKYCHDWVPGCQPDGYREEFDIYKRNGGLSWGAFAVGFWGGWSLREKEKDKYDYKKANKALKKAIGILMKQKVAMPLKFGSCMNVFT